MGHLFFCHTSLQAHSSFIAPVTYEPIFVKNNWKVGYVDRNLSCCRIWVVAVLLRVLEVPSSIIDLKTGWSDRIFKVFLSLERLRKSTSNFPIEYKLYMLLLIGTALLNMHSDTCVIRKMYVNNILLLMWQHWTKTWLFTLYIFSYLLCMGLNLIIYINVLI